MLRLIPFLVGVVGTLEFGFFDVSINNDNSMEFFFTENHYKFEKKLIMKNFLWKGR